MKKIICTFQVIIFFSFGLFSQGILPDSILNKMILYRSLPDRKPDSVYGMEIENIGAIPDDITRYKNLQYFSIYGNDWDAINTVPESFYNLKNITYLSIRNTDISSLSSSLTKFKNLKELRVNNNRLFSLPDSLSRILSLRTLAIDINTSELPPLPQLQELDFTFYSASDTVRINNGVSGMKDLRRIKIEGYSGMLDMADFVGKIKGLPKLEEVSFSWDNVIGGKDLAQLSQLVSLKKLSLKIIAPNEESFKNLNKLESVQIGSMALESDSVKKKCIGNLAGLPQLKMLTTRLDPALVEEFKKIKNVNLIVPINDTYHEFGFKADNVLEKLKDLKTLDSLVIINSEKYDPKNLDKINYVKILNLQQCDIRYDSLGSVFATLSKIPNLEKLYISFDQASSLFPEMAMMKQLKYLMVSSWGHNGDLVLPPEPVEEALRKMLPQCKIIPTNN